ncbi:MAG: c-type cytochrome [Anaerolineae bacterium]
MVIFKRWRLLVLALMTMLLVACTDLAGEVAIVATIPPQRPADAQNPPLPDTPPDLENGAQIYQQNCTRCHGENGAGNGELVESGEVPRMPSFLEPAHMRQQTVAYYYDIISNGNLANLMPPWRDALSAQERWDVALYAYTLHYEETLIAQGEALAQADDVSDALQLASDAELAERTTLTGEDAYALVAYQRMQTVQGTVSDGEASAPVPALESANFSGVITQGSPNADLPTTIRLQLQYGDFNQNTEVLDGTVDADGRFSFEDVPVLPNSSYFAVAFYDGRAFLSDPLTTNALQAENSLDVTVYETSTAPNIVNQTGMDIIIDYVTVPDLGTGLMVNQVNTYENPTDYVFHLQPEGQDVRVSLLVSLPVGAVILDPPEQTAFIPVQDQYALIDTRPVYPGEHIVETDYFIPYDGNAQTVDIRLNNRFDGDVTIIVSVPELQVASDTYRFEETIAIGSEQNPLSATVYSGSVDFQAGASVTFDIEGHISDDDTSVVLTRNQVVPILIAVFIATILVMVGVMLYLRRNQDRTQREIDLIMAQISQLDQQHDAGEINHDAYQQQRAELRQRLAQLMDEGNTE